MKNIFQIIFISIGLVFHSLQLSLLVPSSLHLALNRRREGILQFSNQFIHEEPVLYLRVYHRLKAEHKLERQVANQLS